MSLSRHYNTVSLLLSTQKQQQVVTFRVLALTELDLTSILVFLTRILDKSIFICYTVTSKLYIMTRVLVIIAVPSTSVSQVGAVSPRKDITHL